MRRIRLVLISVCFLGLAVPAAGQHWTPLSTPFTREGCLTNYFLTPDVGFSFFAGVYSDQPTPAGWAAQLARTTDGGLTWTLLPFFDSIGCSITQLCFVSLTHGYSAVIADDGYFSPHGEGGIYETFDQGINWKRITPVGSGYVGIYATSSVLFALAFVQQQTTVGSFGGPIYISRNDGLSWEALPPVSGVSLPQKPICQGIFGNRDSLVATVFYLNEDPDYLGASTYVIYSTDLGASWESALLNKGYGSEMLTLHISPHSCNIIREYIGGEESNADTYSFLSAYPPYSDWKYSINSVETGAWISGNSCAMYICYAGFDSLEGPLLRSTDNGISWHPIGTSHNYTDGPDFTEIDDQDYQALSVVGNGAVVYSGPYYYITKHGSWKSLDGGDGAFNSSSFVPQLVLGHVPFPSGNDTLNVDACTSLLLYHQNIACAIANFDSVTIDGLALSEYSQTSTHYCGCLRLPDTTSISLQPSSIGLRNITIHYHFTDDEFNTIDTSIRITLVVNSVVERVAINANLKQTNIVVSAGDTVDIPIYLSSAGALLTVTGKTNFVIPVSLDTMTIKILTFISRIPDVSVAGPITFFGHAATLSLQSQNGLVLDGETLIGSLRCVVYLADTLQTSVSLAGAAITSSDPRCLSLTANSDVVNIRIQGCGNSTLMQFMRTGQPFSIQSITPNPATNNINIHFQNASRQPISFELTDVLGAVRQRGVTSEEQLLVDATSLPSGVYYFRASQNAGGVVSRSVLVQR